MYQHDISYFPHLQYHPLLMLLGWLATCMSYSSLPATVLFCATNQKTVGTQQNKRLLEIKIYGLYFCPILKVR